MEDKEYDLLQRLIAIRDKIDAEGPEALTDEDKAIVQEVVDLLKPIIDTLVKVISELAEKLVVYIYDILNGIPSELKAKYLQETTERPVGIASAFAMPNNLAIGHIHDHVGIEVGNISDMPAIRQRSEERWLR